jgi:hypothetical protein
LVALAGLRQTEIAYEREVRHIGKGYYDWF